MSSTNMGLTAGSSGRASAEPIISRVIPCNIRTESLPHLAGAEKLSERERVGILTFFILMLPHSSSWNEYRRHVRLKEIT